MLVLLFYVGESVLVCYVCSVEGTWPISYGLSQPHESAGCFGGSGREAAAAVLLTLHTAVVCSAPLLK